MATQREGSKEQDGWLPSSPVSLNAGTGWGAASPSAEGEEANAGTEPAHERESRPHYLTTSGLFERPARPAAWDQASLESAPVPTPEPSELVDEFRSALLRPQSKEDIQPRKGRKGVLALAVVGLLFAAAAAAIYLYHPSKSAAEFQTAKTWVAKGWTSNLLKISNVLHFQAAGQKNAGSNGRRDLGASLRERRPAAPGVQVAPAALRQAQQNENVTPFVLYITDSFGRRWILTPSGREYGPVNQFGDLPVPKPGQPPMAPKDCRSLFYPGCP